MKTSAEEVRSLISALLEQQLAGGDEATARRELAIEQILGDGSARRFYRVSRGDRSLCLAVLPAGESQRDLAEARSSLAIARHLQQAGVPVPELLAADTQRGVLLFEDLGDCRLHDVLRQDRRRALDWYPEIISQLARMQVQGAAGFRQSWCYDAPLYDQQVMLEQEAMYFANAFWRDTLFGEEVTGLREEFQQLAERAAASFELLFLHRDFQCRNIMITDGRIRIIDFQAGRLGPPGYDIASLLIDPYAALPDDRQQELLQLYLNEMGSYGSIDVDKIKRSYPLLAVQRNLQIVGAFAYLSGRKGKAFFRSYIVPSLIMLQNRLADPRFDDFPLLRSTVSAAISRYRLLIRE